MYCTPNLPSNTPIWVSSLGTLHPSEYKICTVTNTLLLERVTTYSADNDIAGCKMIDSLCNTATTGYYESLRCLTIGDNFKTNLLIGNNGGCHGG